MQNKDEILLEKAYLSVSNPVPEPSSEEMEDYSDSEEIMNYIDDGSEAEEMSSVGTMELKSPVDSCSSDDTWEEENEEDEMTITNLDSIRESITKIASFCSGGGHLESWQQQKLAIAMDSLAEVARRIRR